MFVVVVTFGNMRNQVYCGGIRNYTDAEKLKDAAKVRGYKDARVLNAKDFFAPHEAARGSQAAAA